MGDNERQPLKGDVMDVEGVAEYLGLAPSTIYDKVRDLDMPHTRLGNLIRFRKTDIDLWLGENTVRPHPSLQKALAEAAERFFYEHWVLSVGLDPENYSREEALEAFESSLTRFSPLTEQEI
jgi:excisionase family DNA binding protein